LFEPEKELILDFDLVKGTDTPYTKNEYAEERMMSTNTQSKAESEK
jgi:hypothetical protein